MMNTQQNKDLAVASIAPNLINISICDLDAFKNRDNNSKLSIGSYVQIAEDDDYKKSIVGVVQSYSTNESQSSNGARQCILNIQPIGFYDQDNKKFTRGIREITIPPCNARVASSDVLKSIYSCSSSGDGEFSFGKLAQDNNVEVSINGNRFFSKHIGVVGSTGSGKSCTVSKLIQSGITAKGKAITNSLNNSHVVIFDLHGEYKAAFPENNSNYHVQHLSIDNLMLPYWLMNSEELEDMFIESQEQNSHNQVSQFKYAVIKNKEKHNPTIPKENISYDLPVYFSILEVLNYLCNKNHEVVNKKANENHLPKLLNGSLISQENIDNEYFLEKLSFVQSSTAKDEKASNGAYHGEFNRFTSRLETKLSDRRLDFLLQPKKNDQEEYKTEDLQNLLQQFTGYIDCKANVTVIDLSGIPFEVLSIVVSLISRLLFEFCFYYKRTLQNESKEEVPFLLVLEEAHNYIPKKDSAKYNSVKKSVERIAKEGRKYGISLMVVSQRPSEVSDTIFSQCNNFVAMRLTNPVDQDYVKRLLPDSIGNITENLPMLEQGEALLIGDSISLPSIIQIDKPDPLPKSNDIDFYSEWKKSWTNVLFDHLIQKITRKPS